MRGWWVAWLLLIASPALAAPPSIDGAWVVRAGAIPLMLILIERQPNGDAGVIKRPRTMSVSAGATFNAVEGPAIAQRIIASRAGGDSWELTLAPRRNTEQPPILIMHFDQSGSAQLGWKGTGLDEVTLERATAGTKLPASWDKDRTYFVETSFPTNAELAAMFKADQADRSAGLGGIDWAKVTPRDELRRRRTKAMLEQGALASGDDYFHAAFIFQHGGEPNSYLLAHVLATTAVARGRRDAAWIAAATLDRYLQSIGQKQVYGTQYKTRPDGPPTQEPYDRTFMSDALRKVAGVPPRIDQERRRAELEEGLANRQPPPRKP